MRLFGLVIASVAWAALSVATIQPADAKGGKGRFGGGAPKCKALSYADCVQCQQNKGRGERKAAKKCRRARG